MKQQAWGHVVAHLLNELPTRVSEDLLDKAKVLDGMYIPTRYAKGHPEGAPFEHYGKIQSRDAINYAGVGGNYRLFPAGMGRSRKKGY